MVLAVIDMARADPKPLVRAWSVSLLARLGVAMPRARQTLRGLIVRAEDSEAASVKARIRQFRRAGALDWMDA